MAPKKQAQVVGIETQKNNPAQMVGSPVSEMIDKLSVESPQAPIVESVTMDTATMETTPMQNIAEGMLAVIDGVLPVQGFRQLLRNEMPSTVSEMAVMADKLQRLHQLSSIALQVHQEVLATIPGR